MFKPFFLRRADCSDLSGFIKNQTHQFMIPDPTKIHRITPESLRLVPCENPMMIKMKEGIPFDLQAMILLLRPEKNPKVIEFLTKGIPFTDEEPLMFVCGGSMVENKVPCIKFTKSEVTVVMVSFTKKLEHRHCYQLHYTPAAAAA